MAIDQLEKKYLKQVEFKSHHSVNCSGSGGGSSARSNVTCHKCVKNCHIYKDIKSMGTGSSGNPTKKSTKYLPEWVTENHVISDTKYMVTVTMA